MGQYNQTTINATVRKTPFNSGKVVSVNMVDATETFFDAKAFSRSPQAMQALAALEIKQEVQLTGHWEKNPKNNLRVFVVDYVGNAPLAAAQPALAVPKNFVRTGKQYMDKYDIYVAPNGEEWLEHQGHFMPMVL